MMNPTERQELLEFNDFHQLWSMYLDELALFASARTY